MQITLNFTKTIHENAGIYFDKAKKAKKKLEGAKKALEISKQKMQAALHEQYKVEQKVEAHKTAVQNIQKKEWYEKFHWFYSSDDFLVIGGRDAITNELVIKKHTAPKDLVFHTDLQGSPFFVIKTEGKEPTEHAITETATATALYSRAWKLGFVNVKVGWILPEQVTKTAKAGEYVERGAFVITGKMHYVDHDMRFAIGVKEGRIIAGPYTAVKAHADHFVEIVQGEQKPSDLAKTLRAQFKAGTIDEIIRMLPVGNCKVRK